MKFALPLIFCLSALTVIGQEPKPRYDKFKDLTTVQIGMLRLKVPRRMTGVESMALVPAFTHKGRDLAADVQDFDFWFYSGSSDWEFDRSAVLVFLADGERLTIPGTVAKSDVVRGYGYKSVGVMETVGFVVPRAAVEKIANAKTVELQLGRFESALSEKDIAAVKTLLRAGTK